MTALVGRVPIGGQVTDPYSFKVIIGRENLMANGIELPDVAYSIASGKAVGDWTLGCVRGDLHSITFVFQDGTIRTVPKAQDIYEGTASKQDVKIGELSDAFGNPCVVGQRITNAYTYLAHRMGMATASPTPMLRVTLVIRGTSIRDLYPNFWVSSRTGLPLTSKTFSAR